MTAWKRAPWKTRQKMCETKKRFGETTAHKVAKKLGQRAYLCPVCSWWHLARGA